MVWISCDWEWKEKREKRSWKLPAKDNDADLGGGGCVGEGREGEQG